MSNSSQAGQPAVKDEDSSHPIASDWRDPIRKVVEAFAKEHYAIVDEIPSVAPITAEVAMQIQSYIEDYGETLIALPEETWQGSVAQWMGSHWEILVGLWSAESGESDLVLSARVFEETDSVHLP